MNESNTAFVKEINKTNVDVNDRQIGANRLPEYNSLARKKHRKKNLQKINF